MRKCYMINTPWVFQTVWYFVQGLLAARTLAKIAVLGSDFKGEIQKDVPAEFLPSKLIVLSVLLWFNVAVPA